MILSQLGSATTKTAQHATCSVDLEALVASTWQREKDYKKTYLEYVEPPRPIPSMAPSSAADRSGYYAPDDETSYEAPQDRQRIRQYGAKKATYPVTPASGPREGSRPPERESTHIARPDFGAQIPTGEY
jgi:hypothetical protein